MDQERPERDCERSQDDVGLLGHEDTEKGELFSSSGQCNASTQPKHDKVVLGGLALRKNNAIVWL